MPAAFKPCLSKEVIQIFKLGTVIHLKSCTACRTEHDGLLEAARRFADITPE